ncbi:hypothetical protein BC936DRAFT_143341 [Jimgerdemannia flammicorona]|uniref:Uncharacterized protein n=1 Tax=Jimgerdemannia flammicorona TaxID=994334 RepID=A0A432ZZJ0_9FUNG|nr:hypothetical protein BC936DRAFT_143341 [Jimgerdemannia flammicorona]
MPTRSIAEKKQNAPKPSEKPSENAIEPGKTQDRPAQHTQLAPKLAAPDLTFVFKPPVLAVDQPAPTAQDLHHKARREDAPAKGTKELMTEILANISCSSPPSPALFTSPRSIVEDHSSEQSAPADVLPERAEHKPHQVASEVADVRVKDPHANGEVMVEGLMGKKEEDRQANGCVVIPLVPSTSTAKKFGPELESPRIRPPPRPSKRARDANTIGVRELEPARIRYQENPLPVLAEVHKQELQIRAPEESMQKRWPLPVRRQVHILSFHGPGAHQRRCGSRAEARARGWEQ